VYRAVIGLLIIAPLVFSLAGPPPDVAAQSTSGGSKKIIADNDDKKLAAELSARGGVILVDYGAFALWSVPAAQATAVRGQAGATVHDDFDTIALRGGLTVDTTASPPVVPSGLAQTRTSDPQLWLVQFVGPIKQDWLDDLRAAGLELVMYMPQNAYVVWGDGTALANLDRLVQKSPVIQFTGAYHPAYRIEPSLQQASQARAANEPVSVTVQFYTTKNTAQSLANLRSLGGQVYLAPTTVTTLTDISLDLPAGQVTAVAAWPDVFNVEPYVPPGLRDEAQGQIVAGNVTTIGGNIVPITGTGNYLAFLASKGFPTHPAAIRWWPWSTTASTTARQRPSIPTSTSSAR